MLISIPKRIGGDRTVEQARGEDLRQIRKQSGHIVGKISKIVIFHTTDLVATPSGDLLRPESLESVSMVLALEIV